MENINVELLIYGEKYLKVLNIIVNIFLLDLAYIVIIIITTIIITINSNINNNIIIYILYIIYKNIH